MNYKHFKKTHSDENTTTLIHPQGHQIKIAHKGLTDKLRKELDLLPMHSAKHYKDGGDVTDEQKKTEGQGPVQIFVGSSQPGQAPPALAPASQNPAEAAVQSAGMMPAKPLPETSAQAEAERVQGMKTHRSAFYDPNKQWAPDIYNEALQKAQQAPPQGVIGQGLKPPQAAPPDWRTATAAMTPEQPQAQAEPQAMPEAPAAQPQAPRAPAAAASVPKTPEQEHAEIKTDYLSEMQKLKNDLMSKEITPQTYGKLFHDAGVLGKIGMIFSTVLGGFGAGLTRQPNAALSMMDKLIEQDLEAQKANLGKRVSLLDYAIKHEMQRAQLAQMERQIPLTAAQVKAEQALAQQRGFEVARMTMNLVALQNQAKLVDQLRRTAPGSQQLQNAENMLAMMSQSVDAKNANIADLAAGREVMMKRMYPTAGEGGESEFQQRAQFLRATGQEKMAETLESHHIPGTNQQTSVPIAGHDRDKLEAMAVLDNKVKDVIDYAIKHRGSVDPSVTARAAQKAEELTAFYNKSVDSLGMTEGRLSWLEKQVKSNPTSVIQQVLGNNERLREIRDSNLGRRDILLQKYGVKPQKQTGAAANPMEGKTAVNAQGERIKMVNGVWQKVK